ncbi:phosphate ABC transporter inner membrane subunit PstC [Paucilactobacillus oligofermentans DSM 15707 = LMG 22743]|uniref:Phosphate transport system permease protein n=1 Tax=Paucilactobacillus oligofermentans DSM 15707 = LMG 22743 TaxID=1423778 RepID=A0A0R1RRY9_9LACO|nr:phosphate ABC transporter permease subunit PstC [Paucilactobacillus oligofermentans]KRL56075.1 phosphate ABC transporter inner membrane subunit PstC [Paucilactobacillus oligofermentans DSM 15707 = LMG 22743]CUS25940.1 Phosphate ABC transporter permease protein PstC [Paucilactobacillus oligofermentans DSM 15707 = LMG 22743]
MDEIKDRLLKPSKATHEDQRGKFISYLSIGLIAVLVISILVFITIHGLAMFTQNGMKISDFLFKTDWNPGKKLIGALPMIVTSFGVTLLSALIATPFAIAVALFMTEFAPKRGAKFLQVIIELLVGIPSVIYGLIGLAIVVPAVRTIYGGTGFGILAGAIVLFVMVLPTITSLTVDSLKAVPRHYRQASLALGATRWQTIYKVILRAATPGILTAVVFGMARAFGEALAVQMVIGNAAMLPQNLTSPSATLTSQLTMGIGNTIMGTLPNNALWSLALLLLIMSLVFNLVVKLIARKGRIK